MKEIFEFISIIIWIAGIVIAKGFWMTFWAVIIPFFSWFLVIEHFLLKYDLLQK